MSVYSLFGDEVYTGTTSGQAASGEIALNNGKGTSCLGERHGTAMFGSGNGHGLMTCSDGTQVVFQYTQVGHFSGYGIGKTSAGVPVRFTFGLSPEERTQYLGRDAQQTAAAPGAPPSPGSAKGSGTGFFITRQGQILTNAHVVDGCKTLSVSPIGGAPARASVVSSDKSNDLAVLSTDAPVKAVAQLRGGQSVRQGETIVVYGFPLSDRLSSGGAMTNGSISALAGPRDDTRFLQISAPIQPGNSGGPLLDMTGSVVGVVSARLRDRAGGPVSQNVNFAIKTEVVRTFLAAVGVQPESAAGGRELAPPDIGDKARAFTVYIECGG
jgi:S1-C subfamily serine protease